MFIVGGKCRLNFRVKEEPIGRFSLKKEKTRLKKEICTECRNWCKTKYFINCAVFRIE